MTPFFGREAEFGCLLESLREARRGRASAVFVAGEGGVGKTRLVSELARAAAADADAVLSGGAIDVGEAPPFWPVIDALRGFLRVPENAWAAEVVRPFAGPLSRLLRVPALSDAAAEDAGSPPLPTVELLFRVVAALAGQVPVVLSIDDLHWADRSTRNLLVYLLANLSDERVLLVATWRTDAPGNGHPLQPLLSELHRDRRVRFVELEPLSRGAVAAIVAQTQPVSDPELVELVWRRCGGNAFVLEETLRAAREGDARALPATLRQLVLGRIALLPEAAQRVARALAVGEEPVEHQLLAEVVDLPEAALLAALRVAVEAAVVIVDSAGSGYRFRHGLLREVIGSELLPGERISLHRRYGLALAALTDPADPRVAARLARHWDLAGEVARALPATVAAAQEAERLFGFAEASRHWQRALELLDRQPSLTASAERTQLLEKAAEAAHLAGDHDRAVAALRDRLRLANPVGPEPARLQTRLGITLLASGRMREAVEAYRQASALLPVEVPAAKRAAVLAGYAEALLQTGDYSGSRREAQRALELARAAGVDAEQARILATLGFSLAYLEDPDAGLAAMTESLRVAEESAEAAAPEDVGQAFIHLAELLSGPLNQLARGVEVARRGVARSTELGVGRSCGVALLAMAANGLFRLGCWDEAAAAVEQALLLRPTGVAALRIRLAHCRLLVGRGPLAQAEKELEAVEVLSAGMVGPRYRVPLLTLRAGLAMWRRRPDLARDLVDQGLQELRGGSDDVWVVAPLVWHGLRAEAESAALVGRVSGSPSPQLQRLRAHMQALDRQAARAVPAIREGVTGYLELCEAEETRAAGRSDPDAWEQCARTWQRQHHPYPAAYAQLRLAEALLAHRARSARAAQALLSAFSTARALAARPFLAEVVDLATRARIPLPDGGTPAPRSPSLDLPVPLPVPPPHPPPELSALTSRELEVLAELAEGRSNREIGERLFISEKTVGVHVSHILAKLGLRTRVQASALLHRARTAARDGGRSQAAE